MRCTHSYGSELQHVFQIFKIYNRELCSRSYLQPVTVTTALARNQLHNKCVWFQLANMTMPLSVLSDGSMATFGKLSMQREWKATRPLTRFEESPPSEEGKLSKFLTQLVRHSLWVRWIHKTGVCGHRLSADPKNWVTRAACFLSRTQIHYIGLFHDMPCWNNAFIVTSTHESHKTVMKQ